MSQHGNGETTSTTTNITTAQYNEMHKTMTRLSQSSARGGRRRLYSKKSFSEASDLIDNVRISTPHHETRSFDPNDSQPQNADQQKTPLTNKSGSRPKKSNRTQSSLSMTVEADVHIQSGSEAESVSRSHRLNTSVSAHTADADLMPPPKRPPPKNLQWQGILRLENPVEPSTFVNGVRRSTRASKPRQTYWSAKREDVVFLTINEYTAVVDSSFSKQKKAAKKKTKPTTTKKTAHIQLVPIAEHGDVPLPDVELPTMDEGIQCSLTNMAVEQSTYISSEEEQEEGVGLKNESILFLNSKKAVKDGGSNFLQQYFKNKFVITLTHFSF